jgi:DNA-binding GntR family transcriptional regulator
MLSRTPTVSRSGLLRDQVYDLIAEDIRSSYLPAGHRILEVALSERYNVSRTPVREALIRLCREGLIEPADRGYVVTKPDRRGLLDRLFVRLLLDPEVAKRAACDATADQIEALKGTLQEQKRAHEKGDAALFARANEAFRDTIRTMCGNTVLANSAAQVDEQYRAVRGEIHRSRANRARTLQQCRDLLDAIETRQPELAAERMRGFISALLAEAEATRD